MPDSFLSFGTTRRLDHLVACVLQNCAADHPDRGIVFRQENRSLGLVISRSRFSFRLTPSGLSHGILSFLRSIWCYENPHNILKEEKFPSRQGHCIIIKAFTSIDGIPRAIASSGLPPTLSIGEPVFWTDGASQSLGSLSVLQARFAVIEPNERWGDGIGEVAFLIWVGCLGEELEPFVAESDSLLRVALVVGPGQLDLEVDPRCTSGLFQLLLKI